MADVRPFRGLRYNPEIAGELSQIICPPFDTISPELQQALYRRSPYNVVRLESGERLPSDNAQDSRYTRAATLLARWLDEQVLVRNEEPAYYLVQHTFEFSEEPRSRLELMGCVRLEEYQRRVVLPHEYTRDEDKRDRLALMEACRANFSPVMCLYRDKQNKTSAVFQRAMAGLPTMEFSDPGRQDYKVWRIDDQEGMNEISKAMESTRLYIADGHHRYETALTYRDLASAGSGSGTRDEAFNFVMMGLIEFDDPGLMVLPYYRVLGDLTPVVLTQVQERLSELFDMEPFSVGSDAGLGGFLEEIVLRGSSELALGIMDPGGGGFQLLSLKREVSLDAWGPLAQSEAWILEEQVLKPVLGDSLGRCIAYIHDADEAQQKVKSGEYQLGFFLKPFPLGLFETIVDTGHRLPPKSTFFYPKLPAGLVLNLMEGRLQPSPS